MGGTAERSPASGRTTWPRSSSARRSTARGSRTTRVDEVVLGAANQAGEDNRNVARMAGAARRPAGRRSPATPSTGCARAGCRPSSPRRQAIRCGEADLVVAGGVESMTRAPWVMAKPGTPWARPGEVSDTSLGWRFTNPRMKRLDGGKATISMGETAEEVAALDGISREDSDALRAAVARAGGRRREGRPVRRRAVAVETAAGHGHRRRGPRADTSLERLGRLKPAFRDGGVVTAGSSSPLPTAPPRSWWPARTRWSGTA